MIADCALAHAMRDHTHCRPCGTAGCQPSCRTRATERGWLRFCQRQQWRSRSGVGRIQRSVMVSKWRIQVIDWDRDIDSPAIRRLIRPGGVITVWCWIVLAATIAMAQSKRRNGNGERHHAPRSEWKGRGEREGGDAPPPNQGALRQHRLHEPPRFAERVTYETARDPSNTTGSKDKAPSPAR